MDAFSNETPAPGKGASKTDTTLTDIMTSSSGGIKSRPPQQMLLVRLWISTNPVHLPPIANSYRLKRGPITTDPLLADAVEEDPIKTKFFP